MPDPQLVFVNPLPRTLHHFRRELQASAGDPAVNAEWIDLDIEVGAGRRWRRLAVAARCVCLIARLARAGRPVVVLWPIFGLYDAALWRVFRPRRPVAVIVHDPVPLRRQVGYGRGGTILGRWGSRSSQVRLLALTELAAEAMRGDGILVEEVVPHPLLSPRARARGAAEAVVLVAGQHKEARDLDLLDRIAREASPQWQLRIVGRGWPAVDGWDVTNGFVSEAELDRQMEGAAVVLIPYSHYFQSGIATRAYELGVPVVARRHEYIVWLCGEQWPGLVESDSAVAWVDAIAKAMRADSASTDAFAAAGHAWRSLLSGAVTTEGLGPV